MQNIYAKTAPRLPQRVLAFVQSLSLRGGHLEVPPGLSFTNDEDGDVDEVIYPNQRQVYVTNVPA